MKSEHKNISPEARPGPPRAVKSNTWRHDLLVNKSLYILAIPVILYFIIFYYVPMPGSPPEALTIYIPSALKTLWLTGGCLWLGCRITYSGL